MNETESSTILLIPWISLAITAIINISGLTINIFLLSLFIKSPYLHTLENSFVINLFVSDIYLGFYTLGHAVFLAIPFEDKEFQKQLCLGISMVNTFVYGIQFNALFWLTLDRFVKVVYPFTYERIFSKRNLIIILTIPYIIYSLQTLATWKVFQWDTGHFCIFFHTNATKVLISVYVAIFCGMVPILGMNLKILMVARRQHREIMTQARPVASQETRATNSTNIGKVLGILTLFTFVTYIPSWFITGLIIAGVQIRDLVFDGLAFSSLLLWNANALVDGLAFLFGRKDIKETAWKFLKS